MFEWDEAKAAHNLDKHGVSFYEAETVFGDALGSTYPDSFHSRAEQRWITIGMSEDHRVLVVAWPTPKTVSPCESSVHGKPLVRSGNSMKKDEAEDELLPEYDFAQMTGGVRGKYAAAYRRSHHLVRLDPDVAKAFTTDEAVNEALRAVLRAAAAISGGAVSGR